jgi:hypothetical protein
MLVYASFNLFDPRKLGEILDVVLTQLQSYVEEQNVKY